MEIQRKDGHLQVKERGLRGNQPRQHMMSDFSPQLLENKFLLFELTSLWYLAMAAPANENAGLTFVKMFFINF